jgi:AP-3 complex subunit mu
VPWRRSNVRHTSNELYVDMIETITATVAPSGRPISALAHGSIVVNSKLSGVPDLPVFHPCVRLSHWRDRPGELSFIPPDGKFVLAGYDVELLSPESLSPNTAAKLQLPASVTVDTSLGPIGADFEVKLSISSRFLTSASVVPTATSGPLGRSALGARLAASAPGFGSGGTTAQPTIEGVVVRVPIPDGVRNMSELRPSRGEAQYSPGDTFVEWSLPDKDITSIAQSSAILRGTVVGASSTDDEDDTADVISDNDHYNYNDKSYQGPINVAKNTDEEQYKGQRYARLARQNAMLMPSAATVSFTIRGWLASGIKVESLEINTKSSRGLGAGVTPYKGVKYQTVSRDGIEIRC